MKEIFFGVDNNCVSRIVTTLIRKKFHFYTPISFIKAIHLEWLLYKKFVSVNNAIPFFFLLALNAFPDIGLVGWIEKKT